MKIKFDINNEAVEVDVDPMMPLLWVLRDELKLKGTKYGCGKAACVLVRYMWMERSFALVLTR